MKPSIVNPLGLKLEHQPDCPTGNCWTDKFGNLECYNIAVNHWLRRKSEQE
jgi:hypothetical protein